jgi:hypothetical protein
VWAGVVTGPWERFGKGCNGLKACLWSGISIRLVYKA